MAYNNYVVCSSMFEYFNCRLICHSTHVGYLISPRQLSPFKKLESNCFYCIVSCQHFSRLEQHKTRTYPDHLALRGANLRAGQSAAPRHFDHLLTSRTRKSHAHVALVVGTSLVRSHIKPCEPFLQSCSYVFALLYYIFKQL